MKLENQMEEIYFIGGTTFYLDFTFNDEDNSPINLSENGLIWKMARFGRKSEPVLEKTPLTIMSDEHIMRVTLLPADTSGLSGKYVHQVSFSTDQYFSTPSEFLYSATAVDPSARQYITLTPERPKFIVLTHIHSQSYGDGAGTIWGTDENDVAIEEEFNLGYHSTVTTTNMFKTITSFQIGGAFGDAINAVEISAEGYSAEVFYIPSQGNIMIVKGIG